MSKGNRKKKHGSKCRHAMTTNPRKSGWSSKKGEQTLQEQKSQLKDAN